MGIGARESGFDGEEQRKADAEIRRDPPKVVWERIRGGIWVQRLVKPGRHPRPPCACNIYGSPRRRPGDHHDEDCPRRHPW